MFQKIRRILALILVLGLFLPLSKCSKGEDHPATATPPRTLVQVLFPQNDAKTRYRYGISWVDWSQTGALTLLTFTWPLLVLFCVGRLARSRFAWLLNVIEIVLCAGGLWWLSAMMIGGDPLYGAVVVVSVTVLYGCLALTELILALRSAFRRWRARLTLQPA